MNRTALWVWFAGSLGAVILGSGMLCWEVYFRLGAEEIRAAVVLDPDGRKYLEVPHGGKVARFPVVSSEDRFDVGVGQLTVLYNPTLSAVDLRDYSDTELLCGAAFAGMGVLFLALGLTGLRQSRRRAAAPRNHPGRAGGS